MSIDKFQLARKVTSGQTSSVNVYHLETDAELVLVDTDGTKLSESLQTLESDRTVTLTGDVSGSGTLENGENLQINTTVSDDSHGHTGSTITVDSPNKALVSDGSSNLAASSVTATELGYLSGVTSGIQGQLNGKADTNHNHDTVYVKQNQIGAENGVAPLGADQKVPAAYLPSFVDDVKDTYVVGATPYASDWLSLTSGGEALTPEADKIYNVVSEGEYQNRIYRWSGSVYVQMNEGLVLGETSSTAYRGDRGKAAYDHSQSTHARVDATAVSGSDANGYIKVNDQNLKVYEHPTTDGNRHLPSGGQEGDIVKWSASGTGTWGPIPALSKGTPTGGGNAVTDVTVNGHEITLVKGSTFLTEHPPITLDTDTTSTQSPAFGGTFDAVADVVRDINGHVIDIDVETVTLPTETELSLGTPSGSGNVVTGISVSDHEITVSKGFTAVADDDSRLSDARTPLSHTHGDIANDGTVSGDGVVIGTGDRMLISDASDSNKLVRSSVVFDGADTTTALTPKGTFETFLKEHQDISGKADKTETVTSVAYDGTNKKITKTINNTTTDVVTAAQLEADMAAFTGTDGLNAGVKGLVPAPQNTDTSKFLRSDGTWAAPDADMDTTYTFTGGTNGFTVQPSTAGADPINVAVTPSATIAANVNNVGGADVTLTGTNGTNGVTYGATHKSYYQTAPDAAGPSADATLDFGDSVEIPQVTVNTTGHATDLTGRTITLPTETQLSLGTPTGNGNVVTGLTVDDHEITPVLGVTALTSETPITKGTPSGSGNAITDFTVDDHEITPVLGATFVEEGDSRLTDARTPLAHAHGGITNDGKVGSTADMAIVTGTGGLVTTADLTTEAPTTSGTATEFITSVTQNSKGKITATKAAMPATPTATDSAAGIAKLYGSEGSNSDGSMTQSSITTALSGKLATTLKGSANGVAELDANGFVPASQLPSFVDDVVEGTIATFPVEGEAGKIYVDTDTNKTYRWSGSTYVEMAGGLVLGETSTTAYRGDRGKIAYDHSNDNTVHVPDATTSDKILRSVANDAPVWGTETELSLGTPTGDGNVITSITVSGHEITPVLGITAVEEGDSRLTDARTPLAHTHGNITNGGAITSDTAVASGDKIIVANSSGVLQRTEISFDGSDTTKALTPKGTFETFLTSASHTITVISGKKADGTTDITATSSSATSPSVTLGDSGATAGAYGDSAAQTPTYGGTFNVPYIRVNAKGIVTEVSSHTVTIPASDNTDVSVTQTVRTTNGDFPLLLRGESAGTSTVTAGTSFASGVTLNPSTGNLKVTQLNGVAVGSSPKFTDNNYYHTTGSWSGLTYTATANGGAGTLAFTIPTGTTSTTVARGDHTHPNMDNFAVHVQSGTTQPTNQSAGDLWFQTIS